MEQPWFVDDSAGVGNFIALRAMFKRMKEIGPNYGYFAHQSDKTIVVVAEHNLDRAKAAFAEFGFEVRNGHRYLGGFIGERKALEPWIAAKAACWSHVVEAMASVAAPLAATVSLAYASLHKSLQQEWQFVQ